MAITGGAKLSLLLLLWQHICPLCSQSVIFLLAVLDVCLGKEGLKLHE